MRKRALLGAFALSVMALVANPAWAINYGWGYVWANQTTTTACYAPDRNYQSNLRYPTNTICRTGVGAYQRGCPNTITHPTPGSGAYTVRLPGLGAPAGHVQVTAYGYSSERCKVVSWGPSGPDQLVNIQCSTSAGSPVDTRYIMTYVQSIDVFGNGSGNTGINIATGYAWADQPTASGCYTPSLPYQYNNYGAINTICRIGFGDYKVNFPNQNLNYGDVQVTAYGSGQEYCKVKYWNPSDGVRVQCYNAAGAPADTFYTVTFLENRGPG
jgi:hypothetical protein